MRRSRVRIAPRVLNKLNTMRTGYSDNDIKCFIAIACEYFKADLLSNTRLDSVVSIRQVLFYSLRSRGVPYSTIGRAFRKNHATIIYGHKKVQDYINIKDKTILSLYQDSEMLAKEYFNESPSLVTFSIEMRFNIYRNKFIEFLKDSDYLLPYDNEADRVQAANTIIQEVIGDATKSE